MRIAKFPMLVGALALGAVGCATNDGGPTTTTIPPIAFVRYINAVPDTLNTTVRWVDYLEFTPQTFINVPYRGVGQGLYQGLKAGSRHFTIFTADVVNYSVAGNTAVMADVTANFEANKYYTILLTGYARAGSAPAKTVKIIEDVIPAQTANVQVRALNPGLGQGALDFHIVATTTTPITTPTFSAVAEGTYSAYTSFAPAAFATRTAAAGGSTVLASTSAPTGTAGTTSADPIWGGTVGGSIITAIAFPASVPGSLAAASASPSVVYTVDKLPPRTTSP
jgi:hypothetical protein